MDREVAAIADGCTKGGHNKSARAAYMRAAAYFTVALSSADGTKDPAGLLGPTFGEHRRCFDAYAELMDSPAGKGREAIPTELRQLLDSGDKQNFARFFEEGMQAAPRAQRQKWEWRA